MPKEVALFTADFSREHYDLILTTEDGILVRLDGYFLTEDAPDLLSHDGATLQGSVVARLAGPLFPGQYTQVGGSDLAAAIGQVETLVGAAFVQRTDGQVDELQLGTKVFQGDVVRTENGGTLGLTFADGTIFTLASGSRMVLDELVYDPQANDNSGVFNLVEGSFVFIAGQTAKTGGIEITTPASTMGIRGTTGKIDIVTFNGVATVTVSLNPDPDGGLGSIELFDLNGNLITIVTGTETKWIIRPPFTNEPPIEVERTSIELGDDAALLDQAVAAFEAAVARVQSGETFVELPEGDGETEDDTPPTQLPEDEAPEDAQPPRPAPLDDVGESEDETGESGTGNPELDGNDEPVLEQDAGPNPDDDAQLDPGPVQPGTDFADGSSRIRFSDLEVQIIEDNTLTSPLPIFNRAGETVPVTLARGASNGTVVLTADGAFTYTPNPDFEGTDSFVVSGLDDDGQLQESVITVVVDPVNDAPAVNLRVAAATSIEAGEGTPEGSGFVTGTLTYVDVDEAETPGVWSIAAAAVNETAFGTISIDAATGVWTYDLDQEATDTLTDGAVFEETFVATITDAEGSTDVSTLIITVTGTNDSPVITASVDQTEAALITGPGAAEVTDPSVVTTGSVSGTLSYSDVDDGGTPATWSIAADPGNETAFGAISIDAVTGVWTYLLPQDEPIPLNDGETAVEVFTATVTDAGGASAQQAITISITGTNDAPTIVFSIEDVTATVVEDGFVTAGEERSARIAPEEADDGRSLRRQLRLNQEEREAEPSATGTLRYVDTDGQSGAASWSVAAENASLGTMTIDATTGKWHYFLDQDAANSLRQGDEVIETFMATVTDPFGGHASQVITITVQGSNDAAVFNNRAQDLAGSVAEGGVATATGQLTFSDPDALPGEEATWSVTANDSSRGDMQIDARTGQWTYVLNAAAAESLSARAPVMETFTATVTDSLGATAEQIITITLTGENDAPTVATGSATLSKSTASIAIDLFALGSDIDAGESGTTLVYQIATQPGEGSASVSGADLIFSTEGDFNDLSAGESRDVTVGITATDSFGASATGTVVITVTGSNTGPVITSGPSAAEGSVIEAGAAGPGIAQLRGALSYTDDDAATPTSGIWSVIPRSVAFGSMSIDAATGEWVYTLNNTAADPLNEGATAHDVFRATITDADGQTATQDITITITGSNDAPGLVAARANVIKDQASLTVDLVPFGADPDGEDTGATLTYDLDSGPGAGNGTAIVSGGQLIFGTNGDFDSLLAGQRQDVVVRVGVTDAQGLRSVSDVTITVTGSSSAPVITSGPAEAAGGVIESGNATAGTLTASGTLSYDDPDAATATSGIWTIAPDISALGAINIDAGTGAWAYTLDGPAANGLNDGETVQEFFTATITDVDGLTDSQVITITITGSNDAPTLDADSSTITKSTTSVDFDLSTRAADPDLGDTLGSLTFSIENAPSFGSASLTGTDLSFSTNRGFDDLGPGDTRVDTVDVRVTDTNGAFVITTFTITVTGSNAAPQITSAVSAAQADVTEAGVGQPDNGALADATGQLTYTDGDERPGFEATWSVTPSSPTPLGQMSIIADTGAWSYFLNETQADSLRAGETAVDTFVATITDEFGATDTQVMTLTITGTNDAPIVDVATSGADGTVTAGGVGSLIGQINFDDVDDVITPAVWSIAPDSGTTPGFGSMSIDASGEWTYVVNAAAVDALPAGESRTETYLATITDEFGASDDIAVVITIDGSNAAPVITSPISSAEGDVVESGDTASTNLQTSGQLTYADPDEGTIPAQWSIAAIGTPTLGGMSIVQATGLWTYTLNDAAADALDDGDVVVEQFRATVTDVEGGTDTQVISITIAGTNDSPTLIQSGLATLAEDATTTLDLRPFAADVDTDDIVANLTFAIDTGPARGSATLTNGVLSFDTNGEFDDLALGATEDVTINVTLSDGNGGSTTSAITLRVTGTNDAPNVDVTSSVVAGGITENGDIAPTPDTTVSGRLVYTDADEAAGTPASWQITPDTSAFGSITIGATTGIWEYTLDQFAADALQTGQTVTETFTATVEDANGATDTQLISVTITGTNDAPTLTQTTIPVLDKDAIGFTDLSALSADVDNAGGDLSWSIAPGAFKGDATITGASLRFDPNGEFDSLGAGETEDVTINVTVSDGVGGETTSPITIRISGANDAPVITSPITAAQGGITENGDIAPTPATSIGGTLSYTDADEAAGSPATWTIDTFTPVLGTITIGATNGVWEYTLDQSAADGLNAGETRSETFTARVTDAAGASDTQTITVTITGTNDAPTLTAGALPAAEDGPAVTLDLASLGDDADAGNSGTNLAYTTTSTLAGLSIFNNILTFDPGAGFQSLAAGETQDIVVNLTAEDDQGATATNSVTITVTGVNDIPTVPDFADTLTESSVIGIDLSGVGSDIDNGAALSYVVTTVPTKGFTQFLGTNVIFRTNGEFETLAAGQTEDVIIGYRAHDGLGGTSDEGAITFTVTGQNDAPTLAAGTLAATEDGAAVTLDLRSLGNDVDDGEDGGTLTYAQDGATTGASVSAGILTFDPGAGFQSLAAGETQDVTVDILATDAAGAEARNVVSVTVTGVNDDPTLAAGTLAATEDGGDVTLDLSTLSSDPDTGDIPALSYQLIGAPAAASINGNTLTYDPGTGFQTLAAGDTQDINLTVEVDDGNGGTDTNTVTVTVTGVNDTAVFADGSASVGERDSATFIDLSGLITDVDDGEDGTNKTYIIDTPPVAGKGTVTIDGLGVRFDPNGDFDSLLAGQTEDVTFTVQAVDTADTGRVSNVATITVTVTGVNNPPEAQDFTVSHDGDAGAVSIDALAQVLDDDDTEITLVSVSLPGAGNAVIDDMGTADMTDDVILYTPDLVTDGTPDSFTYTVEDGAGNQDSGTVTVNVPQNSAPAAFDKSVDVTLDSRAGMTFSADTNGYYEFVRGFYTWSEAQAAAAAEGGHLATITSGEENETVFNLVSGAGGDIDGWLGATDTAVEGEWRWVEGPEAGQQFWQGDQTGSPVGGAFESWFEGQPSFLDAGANDYLSMTRFGEGSWDDVTDTDPRGYVIEKFGSLFVGSITNSDVINLDAGDTLTYTLDTAIDGLTFNADGTFTFDPNTDAYASLADGEQLVINANYTATDERGASDTAAFTFTITGDNDAPTVVDDSASITAAVQGTGPTGGGWTEWTVASGGNGHFYKFVSGSFEWVDARSNVAAQNAHLATVTSAAERNFIGTLPGGFQTGWLGGSDAGDTGNWRWVEGPEAGQQFSNFSTPVNGSYTTWNVSEPNDSADPYLHFYSNGNWGDLGPGHILGYYAEYSTVQPATGSVAANDSDPEGDAITYALSGSYNGLSMAADGSWTFDRTDAAYEDLADGETRVINAYYTATDANGARSDGRLQIEVTGINNAPVVTDESDDITVNVGAASINPNWSTSAENGHLYEWVSANVTYADAVAGAQALGGHLATITDQAEQDFILNLRPGGEFAYLGGSDAAVEGEWRWTAGPEDGDQFWQGDRTGSAVGDAYAFWNVNNPDPGTANGEDVLVMFSDGRWSDVADTTTTSYVVEYSNVPLVLGNVSLNDADVEGQALSYVQNGTVAGFTLNTDGTWEFDANDVAYAGVTSVAPQTVMVNYTATDTQGGSDTGTLTLNLTAENGAPVLGPDTEEITLIDDPGPAGGGWLQWSEASGGNGHFYQFVSGSINWSDARIGAATLGGHLATITSAGEQAFINSLPGPSSVGWLGAADGIQEGAWRWVDGPEAGQQFWQGDIGGSAVGGAYTNWNSAQPAPANAPVEDVLHTFGDGTWNDITETSTLAGYFAEYSGLPLVTGSIATNDSDPEGDTLTYTATSTLAGLTLNTDGSWTFDRADPAYTYLGQGVRETFSINYTVTDGNGGSSNSIFDIDITGRNDAARAGADGCGFWQRGRNRRLQLL